MPTYLQRVVIKFFFLVMFTGVAIQASAQLPSLDGDEPPKKTTTVVAPTATTQSNAATESTTPPPKKYNYLTWFMEWNYMLIPASLTSGAEIHFEFINRVKKKTAFKPAVGMGGFFFQHVYKQYNYGDYRADVFTRRFGGHFTLGARVVHRLGGLCLRVGYNAMYMQYEWKNFSGINVVNQTPTKNKLLHRIQFEAVGFKSFSKKKPGVGILAGVQYLLNPIDRDGDLLVVKAGIAF